jgi:uncharacterized heparinase superfamily protein
MVGAGSENSGREVPEQVLPDGGHFELSPMYHAIILEDVLDLLNAAHVWPGQVPEAVVAHWREVAGRMLYWLGHMIHPDGGISFFNDAALGIAANFMRHLLLIQSGWVSFQA